MKIKELIEVLKYRDESRPNDYQRIIDEDISTDKVYNGYAVSAEWEYNEKGLFLHRVNGKGLLYEDVFLNDLITGVDEHQINPETDVFINEQEILEVYSTIEFGCMDTLKLCPFPSNKQRLVPVKRTIYYINGKVRCPKKKG